MQVLTLQELQIHPYSNMYLVVNECVTALMLLNLTCHYLYNHSTPDIGFFGYIDVI